LLLAVRFLGGSLEAPGAGLVCGVDTGVEALRVTRYSLVNALLFCYWSFLLLLEFSVLIFMRFGLIGKDES
jgi:hypothetical protein